MSISRAESINWRVSRMMRTSYAGTRKEFMGLIILDGKPVNIDELAFLTVNAGADLQVSDALEREGFSGVAVKIQRAPNVTIVGLRARQ